MGEPGILLLSGRRAILGCDVHVPPNGVQSLDAVCILLLKCVCAISGPLSQSLDVVFMLLLHDGILLFNRCARAIFGCDVHAVPPKSNFLMLVLVLQNGILPSTAGEFGILLLNGGCASLGCIVHAVAPNGILLLNAGCAVLGRAVHGIPQTSPPNLQFSTVPPKYKVTFLFSTRGLADVQSLGVMFTFLLNGSKMQFKCNSSSQCMLFLPNGV